MRARTAASSAGEVAPRHAQVERLAAGFQELQVRTARVGGAAQHDHAAVRPGEIGFDRVRAHVGADGDGIGAVALEGLGGVLFGRGADVAALGVQHQRDVGVVFLDVPAQRLELVLGAAGGEIGDLGLERARVGRGDVGDGPAEVEDAVGPSAQFSGKAGGIRVQADGQQGVGRGPGLRQFTGERHGARGTESIRHCRIIRKRARNGSPPQAGPRPAAGPPVRVSRAPPRTAETASRPRCPGPWHGPAAGGFPPTGRRPAPPPRN